MKILFTGGSSFTGYWFIKELTAAGHEVVATFTKDPSSYEDIRGERVAEVVKMAEPLIGVSFGDEKFIDAIKTGSFDLLCHHAAYVTGYKDDNFDAIAALQNNANNLQEVLAALKEAGTKHILMTGTVFEQNEGKGNEPMRAFNSYGVSKGLTWDYFKYFAFRAEITLGKFVIPNPFGPMDSPKAQDYFIKGWYAGETPEVRTPDYVRDNIHVDLMAKAYAKFAEKLVGQKEELKFYPSGYTGLQKDFFIRFAKEMEPRLNIKCPLDFANQTEFPEPLERVNTDELNPSDYDWDEEKAWDATASFYKKQYGQ